MNIQTSFKGFRCLAGKHTIKVDTSVTPVIHPPCKVPVALRSKVKDEHDPMEREGVM